MAEGWQRVRCFIAVLAMIRFSILIPFVLILTLVASDQMGDALIALADTGSRERQGYLLLATLLASLIVWFTAGTMFRFRFPRLDVSASSFHPKLKWALPKLLALSIPLALIAKIGRLSSAVGDQAAIDRLRYELIGVAIVTLVLVGYRSLIGTRESEDSRDLPAFASLPSSTRAIVRLLALANLLVLVLAPWLPLFEIGAPALLLTALALMSFIGSAMVYYGNHHRIPVLTLVMLWAAFWSFFNDNHQVRQRPGDRSYGVLGRRVALPVSKLTPSPLANYSVASYFDAWWDDLARAEPGTGAIPVVLVAADGGGIRAAYWTAAVLSRLQDLTACDPVPFARHVFAISGVSGGSLGAATFAALAADRVQRPRDCHGDSWVQQANTVLGRDFLSPTLSNALFTDLFERLVPFPAFNDRAVALEKSWEQAWHASDRSAPNEFAQPFQTLWSRDPHAVPLLFLNGTVVETGERSLVQPLGGGAANPDTTFTNTLQIGRIFGTQMPLSTAALLSARFTYVSPAGTIGWQDRSGLHWRRIVDGGYFDNSGTTTLREIQYALQASRHRPSATAGGRPFKLIVIHISNDPRSRSASTIATWWAGVANGRTWLSESRSPIDALLNVRDAHAKQSANSLRVISDDEATPYFNVRLYRGATDLPLGWSLSSEARGAMDHQIQSCDDYQADCAAALIAQIRRQFQ